MPTPRRFERSLTPKEWERFCTFIVVDEATGCWNFSNQRGDKHPKFGWNGWTPQAHRVSWFYYREDAVGRDLHHKCENKRCVNPDHLQPLTPKEHNKVHHLRTNDCTKGHLYTPENTYVYPTTGKRECLTCRRRWDRERSPEKWAKEKQTMTNSSEMRDFARNPKLNWDIVREIRRAYAEDGISQRILARKFEVSQPMIGLIVRQKAWTE